MGTIMSALSGTTSIKERDDTDDTHRKFLHPLSGNTTGPEYIVDFDGPDDPYRPRNWSRNKKLIATALYGLTTMTATWTMAAYFYHMI